MSFTKAAFRVHSKFQQCITIPYVVNINYNYISTNPEYSNKSIKFWVSIATFIVFQPVFIYRLVYLFYKTKSKNAMQNFDEITFNAIFACLITLVNASNYMIVTRTTEMKWLVTECCKLGNGLTCKSNFRIGNLTIQELIIYSLSAALLTVPMAFFFVPFLISWDPIQLVFGTSLHVKPIAACFYGIFDAYNGLLFLSTLLLLLVILENVKLKSW